MERKKGRKIGMEQTPFNVHMWAGHKEPRGPDAAARSLLLDSGGARQRTEVSLSAGRGANHLHPVPLSVPDSD